MSQDEQAIDDGDDEVSLRLLHAVFGNQSAPRADLADRRVILRGEPRHVLRRRLSDCVVTSGNGLRFCLHHLEARDVLVKEYRDRIVGMSLEERIKFEEVHEAMAWALDAEWQLGSFNRGGVSHFPLHYVDTVADQQLAWLAYQGYELMLRNAGEPDTG